MGGGRPLKGGSDWSHTGAGIRRRSLPVSFMVWEGFTQSEGLRGPFDRKARVLRNEGECSGPRGLGGSRTQGEVGENFKGEETHKSNGRQDGATRTGRERIREGIEASKQVKLTERSDSAERSPERLGSKFRLE